MSRDCLSRVGYGTVWWLFYDVLTKWILFLLISLEPQWISQIGARKFFSIPVALNIPILMNSSAIILALWPSISARNTFLILVVLNISILMNYSAIIVALWPSIGARHTFLIPVALVISILMNDSAIMLAVVSAVQLFNHPCIGMANLSYVYKVQSEHFGLILSIKQKLNFQRSKTI